MSEAEISLIRQRMWSRAGQGRARRAGHPAAGRVRAPPLRRGGPRPRRAGRRRRPAGLRPFQRLGTVGAVLRFLVGHQIQLGIRLREGPGAGELAWRRPSRASATTCCATRPTRALRLRPPQLDPGGGSRAAGHRPGEPAGEMAGDAAGQASGLYHSSSTSGTCRLAANRPAPEPGRGARRPGAAGRAGGLRPVRRAAWRSATSAGPAALHRPTAATATVRLRRDRCQHMAGPGAR